MSARAVLRLVLALAALMGACVAGESVDPAVPAAVARLSPDSQAVVVGGQASTPLQVRVLGGAGATLAGVPVTFESDGGTLSATSGTTDASGLASVVLTTTGDAAVQYRVRATSATFGTATFVVSTI